MKRRKKCGAIACLLISLALTGCGTEPKIVSEVSDIPEDTSDMQMEAVRQVEADEVATIYCEAYEEMLESDETDELKIMRSIIKKLGENGYAAVDSENQIDMVCSEKVIKFCEQVEAKTIAEVTIIKVSYSGSFTKYNLETTEGKVEVTSSYYQYENGAVNNKSVVSYPAESWQYTEDGYLMFEGAWFSEQLYVLTLSAAEEQVALRVLPLDEKFRELNRKYILPINYERNNMFLVDWNENDFGELDFYDMFDIFYSLIKGETMPYVPDDNLGISAVYQIPKDEFENVIMTYFNIESEVLQAKTIYNPDSETYEYKPRGFEEVEYPEYPFSEVVGYAENNDGTIILTVNVVFPYAGISKVYAHEVVVRPLEDGAFQYVSNRIIPSEDNYNETWHVDRLTAAEWESLYGENR